MAFLRVEKKKSGTYLRIVESYKDNGVPRHRTLHSLGKVEDYPADQLERIAKKLLDLAGVNFEDIVPAEFREISRKNYGYALVIKKLWKYFSLDQWTRRISNRRRIKFDWVAALQLMIAERLNEPCSKRQSALNQDEYVGFSETNTSIGLQHLYRCLDVLSEEESSLKAHLFKKQQSLFSQELDVVFYDVTTLYFDSDVEEQGKLRQKGYSKDGKAHKTQIVLGLLVDKLRNPITYNIYEGNTSEGKTMADALKQLKRQYKIGQVIIVADSAMISRKNREIIEGEYESQYIIGERLKSLPKSISEQLIDMSHHTSMPIKNSTEQFSHTTLDYDGRRIICTYSSKRARKDAFAREKLIAKAIELLKNPGQLKQSKKRGAGRFIKSDRNQNYSLNEDKINQDARWDGFKAISTNTQLSVSQVLDKYANLFEVEHAFRALKSQLEIRPMYHWTDKRIKGHIAMCFIAYTILNHLRNTVQMSQKQIIKTLDKMQVSCVEESKDGARFYMKSSQCDQQDTLLKKLKIPTLRDVTPLNALYHYFN